MIRAHFTKVGRNGSTDWAEVLPGAIGQDRAILAEVVADRAARKSDLPIEGVVAEFNLPAPDRAGRLSGLLRLHRGIVGRFLLEEVAP